MAPGVVGDGRPQLVVTTSYPLTAKTYREVRTSRGCMEGTQGKVQAGLLGRGRG